MRYLSTVLVFLASTALVAHAQTLVYDGPGVTVPQSFVGVHSIGIGGAVPGWDDDETGFNYKIGAYRMYGSFPWHMAQSGPNVYDWSEFDARLARLRRSGTIKSVTWTYYDPPGYLLTKPQTGSWQMQLVAYADALEFTRRLLTRYPEIDTLECANEVITSYAPAWDQGLVGGFWVGTEAELRTWCERVLDIRNVLQAELKRPIKVLAPSVPGFVSQLAAPQGLPYFLDRFPRRNEFDGFPAHFYGARAENIALSASSANGFTSWKEMREALLARGLTKPIHDNEHGFAFPEGMSDEAMATVVYNYFVKAAVLGIANVTLFSSSRPRVSGDHLAYVGEPVNKPLVKAAIEDAHRDLAGRTVTRVVDPGGGKRYQVTATGAPPPPASAVPPRPASATPPPPPASPKPTPSPAADGGGGSGLNVERWSTDNLTGASTTATGIGPVIQAERDLTASWRYTGRIEPRVTGSHTFRVCTDDGARLWLDGVLMIDQWRKQAATCYETTRVLTAGRMVDVRLEHHNLYHDGAASREMLTLEWDYGDGQGMHPIGKGRLHPPAAAVPPALDVKPAPVSAADGGGGSGLNVERWSTDNLTGASTSATGIGPVDQSERDVTASWRYTGRIEPRVSGNHLFRVCSDDGARLWLDEVLVIDQWRRQGTTCFQTARTLTAGQMVAVRLEHHNVYYDGGPSREKLTLEWDYGDGQGMHLIGKGRLHPPAALSVAQSQRTPAALNQTASLNSGNADVPIPLWALALLGMGLMGALRCRR